MNVTPDTLTWLWPALLAAAGLLAYGLFLARAGFVGRRRGDVPHCARCDYIVGGLDTPRCPECGAKLEAPGAIIHGERHRRRERGVAGLLLALVGLGLGVAALSPGIRQIDWYQYRPAAWVIGDFKSTDPIRSDRAWAELSRRMSAAGLSDARRSAVADVALDRYAADAVTIGSAPVAWLVADRARLSAPQSERLFAGLLGGLQSPVTATARGARDVLEAMAAAGEFDDARHGRLTELALAEQAAPTPRAPEAQWLLNYLGDRELANALTDEQSERFYRQAHAARDGLEVRKICVAGDTVPYRYKLSGRGPDGGSRLPGSTVWWVLARSDRVSVDGKTYAEGGGSMSSSHFSHGTSGSSVSGVGPGKHRLEVTLTLAVYHGPANEVHDRKSKPRWSEQVTLSGEFEVVPEAPPGLETWVEDPSAAEAIRAALEPRDLERRSPREKGLNMMFDVDKLPVNVAFDVIGRVGGAEFPIGTLAYGSGYTTSSGFGNHEFPPFVGDRLDLILRSSETALRKTVDMYKAWRGELVFKDLPVRSTSP